MTTNLVASDITHLWFHSSVGQGLSVSHQLGQLTWVLWAGSHMSGIKMCARPHFHLELGRVHFQVFFSWWQNAFPYSCGILAGALLEPPSVPRGQPQVLAMWPGPQHSILLLQGQQPTGDMFFFFFLFPNWNLFLQKGPNTCLTTHLIRSGSPSIISILLSQSWFISKLITGMKSRHIHKSYPYWMEEIIQDMHTRWQESFGDHFRILLATDALCKSCNLFLRALRGR